MSFRGAFPLSVWDVIAARLLFWAAHPVQGSDRSVRVPPWQMARHLRYRLAAGAGNRSIE